MPKRIQHIVEYVALLATQQGGYSSRQEIAAHVGMASRQALQALLPAKGPRLGPGLNRALDTRLAPLARRQEYRAVPTGQQLPLTTGQFTLPPDCAYVDYYDMPGARTVEEVSGAALRYRRDDPVCGPTAQAPLITTVENGDKQVYPADAQALAVQYYAYPADPVYYQQPATATDPASYDDTLSVDTGWGPDMDAELIVRTLRLLGLEIRDPQLAQTAAQLTAENA